MKLNFVGYFPDFDGYGRFSSRMVRALQRAGVDTRAIHIGDLDRPAWLLEQLNIDWSRLTITCAPPYMLQAVPGRHWLFSMTEGSLLPDGWVETINNSGCVGPYGRTSVERVIVPCRHNAEAFRNSGVETPISVIHGGTDPEEFPLITSRTERPYTFLAFADRNERKGWHEVWDAFYLAFGGKTTGIMDVRMIIKYRPDDNNVTTVMAHARGLDGRIVYQGDDVPNIADVYAQADCVVLPSRSEGWGMPHREAAMSGALVITQAYSGMDDGHTHHWAWVVSKGRMEPIPKERKTSLGEWRIVDVDELAEMMRYAYEQPLDVQMQGNRIAAAWLREHQTWDHAAQRLLELIRDSEVAEMPEGDKHFAIRTG